MKEAIMNQEKLAKLQAQVRIGGKVTFSLGVNFNFSFSKCLKQVFLGEFIPKVFTLCKHLC